MFKNIDVNFDNLRFFIKKSQNSRKKTGGRRVTWRQQVAGRYDVWDYTILRKFEKIFLFFFLHIEFSCYFYKENLSPMVDVPLYQNQLAMYQKNYYIMTTLQVDHIILFNFSCAHQVQPSSTPLTIYILMDPGRNQKAAQMVVNPTTVIN